MKTRINLYSALLGCSLWMGLVAALIGQAWWKNELDQNLTEAIGRQDAQAVHSLLQKGASPNADMWKAYSWRDYRRVPFHKLERVFHYPVLCFAIEHNDTSSARLLLQEGADPNCADGKGNTPLMLAAAGGNVEAVRMLLAKQARSQAINKDGLTALQMAQTAHQPVIVVLFANAALPKSHE